MTQALTKAAQWEWHKNGPTGELMHALRLAIEAALAAPQEPVAFAVMWGIEKLRMNSVHIERETAEKVAGSIVSPAAIWPLYAVPQPAPVAPVAQPVAADQPAQFEIIDRLGQRHRFDHATHFWVWADEAEHDIAVFRRCEDEDVEEVKRFLFPLVVGDVSPDICMSMPLMTDARVTEAIAAHVAAQPVAEPRQGLSDAQIEDWAGLYSSLHPDASLKDAYLAGAMQARGVTLEGGK
jgi:hypothetical protein